MLYQITKNVNPLIIKDIFEVCYADPRTHVDAEDGGDSDVKRQQSYNQGLCNGDDNENE